MASRTSCSSDFPPTSLASPSQCSLLFSFHTHFLSLECPRAQPLTLSFSMSVIIPQMMSSGLMILNAIYTLATLKFSLQPTHLLWTPGSLSLFGCIIDILNLTCPQIPDVSTSTSCKLPQSCKWQPYPSSCSNQKPGRQFDSSLFSYSKANSLANLVGATFKTKPESRRFSPPPLLLCRSKPPSSLTWVTGISASPLLPSLV